MTPEEARQFVLANTVLASHPFVPEIQLRLATEITPIWQATEESLHEAGVEPPFWAFAWPGSVGLARHILDHPDQVANRPVLDIAAGSGIAAIAAALSGSHGRTPPVTAAEIDPLACAAIAINAAANGVRIEISADDPLAGPAPGNHLIIAGDVCYSQAMATRMMPWLHRAATRAEVWLADPGRRYLPATGIEEIARYAVPTSMELEDRRLRETVIYRVAPQP